MRADRVESESTRKERENSRRRVVMMIAAPAQADERYVCQLIDAARNVLRNSLQGLAIALACRIVGAASRRSSRHGVAIYLSAAALFHAVRTIIQQSILFR